jgi:hypothetical protein
MNSLENMEKLIKNASIYSNPDINQAVLKELLQQFDNVKTQKSASSLLNITGMIMKNPITKIAAAAVIIFITITIITQFGGSIDGAGVVFADVRAAFLARTWVHLQYDNNTESWYNLKTGDHCHKQLYPWGDSFVYINRTDNLRQRYTPWHGQYIEENRPAIYKDNIIPPYEPKTAWETIVGHWEKIAEQGDSKYYQVEKDTDTLDGKTVIRFDIYYIDAMNQKLLTKQLWADTVTKLPIRIREKLTSQQQKDQNREYITGVFSFPQTGPTSIYDLGVPRDLPVAKNYDKVAYPAIEKIFETAKQYYEDFPKRCRGVTWQNDRESEIMVVWRDGEKVRLHIYFNLIKEKYPQYHLDVPTTVDEILAWAKTQPPIGIYLDDEEKMYHRSYHPAFENEKTPKTRFRRSWREGLPMEAQFIEEYWQYSINRNPTQFEFIDDAPEFLSKYIGIKTESGIIRRDHYIDPEHDYICIQNIWWKKRDGRWEKEREYIATEMAQLPTGQWYVTKRKLITYPDPERGTVGYEYNYIIDIKLLEKDDFPPDTFNGEKLLEGAEIKTY